MNLGERKGRKGKMTRGGGQRIRVIREREVREGRREGRQGGEKGETAKKGRIETEEQ